MGMDVYGRKPTSEHGEYFRNNVWWWHPLAHFIQDHYADEIPNINKISWHTNDGEGLGARDTKKLVKLLQRDLQNGVVTTFADEYEKERASIPRETCRSCEGKGQRVAPGKIARRITYLQNLAAAPGTPGEGEAAKAALERLKLRGHDVETQKCWSCDGKGTVESFKAAYPFSKDNVEDFERFLRDSGGFRIH